MRAARLRALSPVLTGLAACALVVGGCASRSSEAGPTVPAYTPGASAGASEGDASAVPSPTPSLAPLTPEGLSDPGAGYTLESLPPGLGEQEEAMVRGFVAHYIATWAAVQKADGDLTAVEATTTGTELEVVKSVLAELQAEGMHVEGHLSSALLSVESLNPIEGRLKVCVDQRQSGLRDAAGNKVIPSTSLHRFSAWVGMDATSGTWKVSSNDQAGVDDC